MAFAAVIVVGTLTGAQLKSDKQKEEVSCSLPFLNTYSQVERVP